jgi:hypothetical protein
MTVKPNGLHTCNMKACELLRFECIHVDYPAVNVQQRGGVMISLYVW